MTAVALPWAESDHTELEQLLADVTYRPGWTWALDDFGAGPLLHVTLLTVDSRSPGTQKQFTHRIPAPLYVWDRAQWRRWLLDTLIAIETHEACEWFVEAGTRPFDPHHPDARTPYTVVDRSEA
jgi:hypothetical protein